VWEFLTGDEAKALASGLVFPLNKHLVPLILVIEVDQMLYLPSF